MSDQPPRRRVVARPISPPPESDDTGPPPIPRRSRRRRPTRHPLLIPGLAAGGVVAAGLLVAGVWAAWELQQAAAGPPKSTTPTTAPAQPGRPAPPAGSPATPRTNPPPATAAGSPPPVTTPEPPDAHPGLSGPDPLDRRYPLARDSGRAAALVAERRAWYAAQLDADAAKAHPAYAAVVRAATDAQVEVLAHRDGRNAERMDRRRAAVAAAVDAGCEDPAIAYAHMRYGDARGGIVSKSVTGLNTGRYSPFRRLHANYNDAVLTRERMSSSTVDAPVREMWAAAAELARLNQRVADEELLDVMFTALNTDVFGKTPRARWQQLDAGLAAAGASDWVRAVVEGEHLIDWAWEARGRGYARTVTDDGWRLMKERLTAAEARYAVAHARFPDRPQAAAGMVTVCLGLGRDRAEMEGWFAKAVAAAPDAPDAYRRKLEYLKPKWHGDEVTMLAFARQCLRASGGDDLLNELVYVAYKELAKQDGQTDEPDPIWSRPGVWADLRAAYEPLLAARPGDRLARTRFFRLCVLCGQYPAADAHRRRLAGNWWTNDPALDRERKELEQRLDAALGQPPARKP